MHLGVQTVNADEGLQGGCEVTNLLGGQPVEDLTLVRFGDLPQRSQQDLSVRGEMQLVVAAVSAAAGARDQAALLEVVDECDHPTGGGTHPVREGPLAEGGRSADQAQHGRFAGGQPQFTTAAGKSLGHVRPDLREQEGDAPWRSPLLGGGTHGPNIVP